ncbi:MAG: hypothetical protein ACYSX0_00895 [Planctomycetota bacterium]|jgi:hypothetical protein
MGALGSRSGFHQSLAGGVPDPIKSVFDHAETAGMKGLSRRSRTIGLDKPCQVCGKPIHYTYAGPVEEVCGRCTDKRRGRRVRAYHRGMTAKDRAPNRRSTTSIVVLISIVMVVGAVVVAFALSLLLG